MEHLTKSEPDVTEVSPLRSERGATMVEYGLMVAFILVGSIVAVKGVGQRVAMGFTVVEAELAQGGVEE